MYYGLSRCWGPVTSFKGVVDHAGNSHAGDFFKLSGSQILWGKIGTTVFGILGPITLFPLKTCFWKQQYIFPGIFWVERFYGYQFSGHVKKSNLPKVSPSKVCNLKLWYFAEIQCIQNWRTGPIWIPKFLFGDVATDDVTKYAFWLGAVLIQKKKNSKQ